MKALKTLIAIISISLFTSCGVNWHVSTLNYDPIYEDENYIVVSDEIKIDTLNEFQFRNKLRTDFSFRYDYAQYALSQPRSFDWNNRLLGTRYNWNSPYYGYGYWNRTQMWHDWVWGFSTPHRWSLFGYDRWGYDRWGYNSWMGNAHWSYGWNSYYGWNNFGWNNYYGPNGYYNDWDWRWRMNNYAWQHRNRSNTVYVNGRRGSSVVNNRTNTNSNIQSNVNRRRNNNTRVRSYNNPRINPDNNVVIRDNDGTVRIYRRPNDNNTRGNNNIRIDNNNTRNNNWKPRVPNNVNNRPPVINNSRPMRVEQNTRTNYNTNRSTNVRSSNSRSNGSTQIKRRQ